MKATTSIKKTKTTHGVAANLDGRGDTNSLQTPEVQANAAGPENGKGKSESELRAAARRHGLTLKQLAHLMGVSYNYLSQVATGRRPWSPMMRERAQAVLGEVPGQGVVYRQGGQVGGESTYIRERAREVGLSMRELADRVGISRSYMSQASRGHRNFGPEVQAWVEAALEAPVKVESASAPALIAAPCGTA